MRVCGWLEEERGLLVSIPGNSAGEWCKKLRCGLMLQLRLQLQVNAERQRRVAVANAGCGFLRHPSRQVLVRECSERGTLEVRGARGLDRGRSL